MDRSMVPHTVDPMVRIQIFMKCELEDRCTPLSTDNHTIRQEKHPDPVPSFTVGFDHVVLVVDPVLVPAIDSGRVVNAEDVNILNFKASAFELEVQKVRDEGREGKKRGTLLTTQPREQEASAPGKMYLFIKRPL